MSISTAHHSDERYSAHNMTKPVNFFFTAPAAHSVSVIGDFNHWEPTAHPMQRRVDGAWFVQIALMHGHHEYQFLVDGKPVTDPQAMGATRNKKGELVSLIAIS